MMHSTAAQQQKPPQPQAGKQSNHGTVTKLLENFGFIDDSIFFPLSAVNGAKVNVGDKVYYECTYSQNLPFKWNATLVRMVSSSSSGAGGPFESKQPQQPPPSANPTQHPPYQQHHHAPPPHHHQPPPHQQQQPGNYSIPPPNMYQSNAPPSGPNSGPQPPPPQPNSNYYQQQPPPQQQPQTKLPPPFGNPTSYNNYSGPPGGLPQQQQQQQPPPGQQQPPPQQSAPPPQQQQSQPPQQAAPFPDFAKVQQAVAAAAQLAQLYAPTGNQAGGQNPNQAPPGSVGPSGPANSASAQSVHNNNASSRGPPPPQSTGSNSSNASSQYGQLQYTSTPGSAFISTPPQFPGQTGGPKMGGLPPPHQGRGGGPMGRNWDPREERFDPRRQAGGPGREDPRGGGSRFGPPPSDMGGPPRGPGPNAGGPPHKSRFQDNDRFGPPNSMNDGRFNAPNFGQPEPSIFGRQPPPQQQQPPQQSAGRDEFGREIRKEQESRFRDNSRDNKEPFSRDRDSRDNRDKDHRDHSREKPREVSRDRDRRDRPDFKSRSRKRSISPVNSIASSQGHSTRSIPNSGTSSKRRSDPCNLPKSSILRNRFNPNDLKSRLPGSIHVPSDLKEVFYNVDMDLDLLDIPKPILFKITPIESSTSKSKEKENKSSSKDTAKSSKPAGTKPSSKEEVKGDKNSSKPMDSENKPAEKTADASQKTTNVEEKKESTGAAVSAESNEKAEEKETVEDKEENAEPKEMEIDEDASSGNVASEEIKTDSDAKPSTETKEATKDTSEKSEPNKDKDSDKKAAVEEHKSNSQGKSLSSKTETLKEPGTKNHKFNVKVLLISLPILSEIYERIFGADFDGTSTAGSGVSSKSRGTHFSKIFSLLVTRNSSDGYSLIGGKFVPEMDGFLTGTTEPNLVATAIRVVFEQTGLNLSSCRQWKVFSTFIYNRDTNLDPQQGSYEVTKIYMPDIWSSFESIYAPYLSLLGESTTNETPKEKFEEKTEEIKTETKEDTVPISIQNNNAEESQPMEVEPTTKKEEATADSPADNDDDEDSLKPNKNKDYLQNIMRNMNEMKVADLKSECENLGIKLETRMRKDQLAQRLREHVEAMLVNLANPGPVIDNEGDKTTVMDCTIDRTVPDLVIDGSMISENGDEKTAVEELKEQSEGTAKRKLSTTEIVAPVIADNDKKSSEDDTETSAKKAKLNIESVKSDSEPVTLFATPSNIKVKGNLSILTLSNALNPHRFDQFELVIVAELLRDSLVAHFARYIFTSLLHNNQLQQTPAVPTEKQRVIPVNYVHLAFSFFDKNHCGYINLDDLTNLLNATGYPLSKKVANSLVSGSSSSDQKICYRDFQPPTTNLIDRTPQYPSVGISSALPSSISSTSCEQSLQNGPVSTSSTGPLIIERNCTQYNVDELIKQSEADQKVKVRLNETLTNCTIKNGQLEQIITELETKQKKMSAATGRQNDELCTIKRERDQLKSKYDQLRRAIEKSQSLFSDVLRQHQPAPVPQTNTSTIIPPVADKKDTPPPPVVTPSKTN